MKYKKHIIAKFAPKATSRISIVILFSTFLSGCPPVVHLKVCNNSHALITTHDGAAKQVSPNEIGSFKLHHGNLSYGADIKMTINGKETKYHLKLEDNSFYKQRAFSGLIKTQLNSDNALYLVMPDSTCPEKFVPEQPEGFPIAELSDNVSNN